MKLCEIARLAVSLMMRVGCLVGIFPYGWDPVKYQLVKVNGYHSFMFNVHQSLSWPTYSFILFRFIHTIKDEVPHRLRILHGIWCLAGFLFIVCVHQFNVKRNEIRFFVNSLFRAMEIKKAEKRQTSGLLDWRSLMLTITISMLILNPPMHATLVLHSPCGPQYWSSLFMGCESAADTSSTVLQRLPFVFIEYCVLADVMFIWTFNWSIAFMGLNWISDNMREVDPIGKKSRANSKFETDPDPGNYRLIQLLVVLLNDSLVFYMQWFPSIFFTIIGMMIFAAIRYIHIPFHAYFIFPFCGIRCLIEATTALFAAGIVNQDSLDYLTQWDQRIQCIPCKIQRRYQLIFRKSCPRLKCTAGSLYTFENSIVLVSFDNCTQLTFNMLVTYK